MSNGIQAYENEDGACFLSSGALTYDSRELFSDGKSFSNLQFMKYFCLLATFRDGPHPFRLRRL